MGNSRQSLNQALVTDAANATNNTLNATPTGSADTSILRFNAAATTARITETTTAADGTQVFLTDPGIYHVSFVVVLTGAVAIAAGISFGASRVAAITADPVVGVANVIASADVVGVAALNMPISLSAIVTNTAAAAALAAASSTAVNTGVFMFHASNSAGAAPVGLVAASAQYRITKIANTNL